VKHLDGKCPTCGLTRPRRKAPRRPVACRWCGDSVPQPARGRSRIICGREDCVRKQRAFRRRYPLRLESM
jgi:ribosomal protein S27E